MYTINENHMWCMVPEINARKTQFFVILGHFLPFKPLNNLENQNFEIWKNYLEISLYTCLINEDHMIYGPRDMEHDRQNFSSFWTIFCHFTPQQPGKLKFLKKYTNTWKYNHFTQVCHKWQSYDAWFLRYEVRQREVLIILGHFLPFYPTNSPKDQNFLKYEKNSWIHHDFKPVYQKSWSYAILFLRYGARQM